MEDEEDFEAGSGGGVGLRRCINARRLRRLLSFF